MMPVPSLEEYLAQLGQHEAYITDVAAPQLQQDKAVAGQAAAIKQDAQIKAGQAAATVDGEKNTLQMGLEDKLVALARTQMPETTQYQLAAAVGKATSELNDKLNATQRLQSVDFLDNPIGFVLAQLRLPQAQTDLAQTQQKIELLTNAQKAVAESTTSQAKALAATSRTTTAAMGRAQQDQIIHETEVKRQALIQEAAINNAGFIEKEVAMDARARQAIEDQRKAYMESEEFKARMAANALQMQHSRLAIAKLQKDISQDKANDTWVANALSIARAQAQLTGDKGTAAQLNGIGSVAQLKAATQDPIFADKFRHLYELGALSITNGSLAVGKDGSVKLTGGGVKMLGADPREAALGAIGNNLPLTSGEQVTATAVRDAVIAAQKDPLFNTLDKQEKLIREQHAANTAIASLPALAPSAVAKQEEAGAVPVSSYPASKAINFDNNPEAQKSVAAYAKQAAEAVRAGKLSINDAATSIKQLAAITASASSRYYNVVGFGGKPNMAVPDASGRIDLNDTKGAYKYVLLAAAKPGVTTSRFGAPPSLARLAEEAQRREEAKRLLRSYE